MKLFLALDEPLNRATELTKNISDPEEQKVLRRGIGEIASRAYTDLMLPIARQFPDLDPESRGDRKTES